MNVWPIAWSFPEWKCGRCGLTVRWVDAVVEDTEEIFTVKHIECVQ